MVNALAIAIVALVADDVTFTPVLIAALPMLTPPFVVPEIIRFVAPVIPTTPF